MSATDADVPEQRQGQGLVQVARLPHCKSSISLTGTTQRTSQPLCDSGRWGLAPTPAKRRPCWVLVRPPLARLGISRGHSFARTGCGLVCHPHQVVPNSPSADANCGDVAASWATCPSRKSIARYTAGTSGSSKGSPTSSVIQAFVSPYSRLNDTVWLVGPARMCLIRPMVRADIVNLPDAQGGV